MFSQSAEHRASAPWVCTKTQIKEVANERPPSSTVPVPSKPPVPSNMALRPAMGSHFGSSKKEVKWQTTPSEPALNSTIPKLSYITDFCTTIGTAMKRNSLTLGCLRDAEHSYSVCPISHQELEFVEETISLEHLLSKSSPIRLTRRERYCIALTIATSQLQLRDSPWLGSQWSKNDIFFQRSKSAGLMGDKPYISCSFYSHPTSAQSSYIVADHGMSTLGK